MSDAVVTPPATIGMLGGGQLGRYALMAATTMGYRTIVLDPDPFAPAGSIADEHLVAAYDDPVALSRLASDCAVVTTEFENPSAAALDELAARVRVAPAPAAVRIAQDRAAEKRFLTRNGFPVVPYTVLEGSDWSSERSDRAEADLALLLDGGAVIKTARLGYDGKGQRIVGNESELDSAWSELGRVRCVVEALVDLERELSVLVARTADGHTAVWPIAENVHASGILDLTVVPARVEPAMTERAVDLAVAVAGALDFVGVLAVELFVVAGEVMVNELAPRPHNSGHWTLDASVTSQFEQQIRAVCGLGLGDTTMTSPAVAMVNLLGDLWQAGEPRWPVVLANPDAKLHLYRKSGARRGRKMGHLTVMATEANGAAKTAIDLRNALAP
jgi:5-(carboxyamino)imidazole ribonucleotide synthase